MVEFLIGAVVLGAVMLFALSRGKRKSNGRSGVTLYDNSMGHGGWLDAGEFRRYSPTPAEILAAVTGLPVLDRTMNGMSLRNLVDGGLNERADPRLGEQRQVIPFAQQLRTDPNGEVTVGCMEIDALLAESTLPEFLGYVRRAVRDAEQESKRLRFRAPADFEGSTFSPEAIARVRLYRAALHDQCASVGIEVVGADVPPIFCVDGIHRTQDNLTEYWSELARRYVASA